MVARLVNEVSSAEDLSLSEAKRVSRCWRSVAELVQAFVGGAGGLVVTVEEDDESCCSSGCG